MKLSLSYVTKGHLRVTIGHLRVTIGHLMVTLGHLRVTKNYFRATLGNLKVKDGEGHFMVRYRSLLLFL